MQASSIIDILFWHKLRKSFFFLCFKIATTACLFSPCPSKSLFLYRRYWIIWLLMFKGAESVLWRRWMLTDDDLHLCRNRCYQWLTWKLRNPCSRGLPSHWFSGISAAAGASSSSSANMAFAITRLRSKMSCLNTTCSQNQNGWGWGGLWSSSGLAPPAQAGPPGADCPGYCHPLSLILIGQRKCWV